MTPDEIIAALKRATGPTRVLDDAIAAALSEWINEGGFWRRHRLTGVRERFDFVSPPAYTGSIDEVVKLIPAGLWWAAGVGRVDADEPLYGCRICRPTLGFDDEVAAAEHAHSLILAIAVAALEARKVVPGEAIWLTAAPR